MLNLIFRGGLPGFAAPRWRGLMGQSTHGRCVREGGSVCTRRLCTSADGSGCGLRAGLKEKVFGVLTEAEKTELLTALKGAAQSAGKAAAAAAEGVITRPTLIQVSIVFIMMPPCRLLLNFEPLLFFVFHPLTFLSARSMFTSEWANSSPPSTFAHPSLWVITHALLCVDVIVIANMPTSMLLYCADSLIFTSFAASSVFFGGNDADDWIWVCGQCHQYVFLPIMSVLLKRAVAFAFWHHT